MKSMLSMAILTIFLSACAATPDKTSEVPKYGILPFETENITKETSGLIPDKFNKDLAATVKGTINSLGIDLDKKPLKVYLIKGEQPISRTDVEAPVVSFDNKYKNTLYTDLQAMSKKYDGIIFGHLEEELAGDGSLLLIMRVYRKKDHHIESFEGDAINLGVVTTKAQMTKQLGDRIIQLSKEVKRYIVGLPDSVGSGGGAPEDNGAPEDDKNTPGKDKDNDFFSIAEEVEPKLEGGVLPGKEVKPTDRTKATVTSMSLKEVYKMLYKQKFYVIVPFNDNKHINARRDAAQALGIDKWTFRDSFEEVKRKSTEIPTNTNSCYEKKVLSYPIHSGAKGNKYNICYDVRYLHDKGDFVPEYQVNKEHCDSLQRGRKTSTLTYPQAEKEIEKLRKETGNQQWKIPSIEELYVLTEGHLPYSRLENVPNVIWSSTSLPNQPNRKWVIQAALKEKKEWKTYRWEYSYYPRPRLWDSSNSNLNYPYADTAILFPVYTCEPNN